MMRYGPKQHKQPLPGPSHHTPRPAPPSPAAAPGTAYFLPDSMNLSYSTAILQERACRLWAAEQLVLMTFPAGRDRGQRPVPGYPTPPRLLEQRCFTMHIPGAAGGMETPRMLDGFPATSLWAKNDFLGG